MFLHSTYSPYTGMIAVGRPLRSPQAVIRASPSWTTAQTCLNSHSSTKIAFSEILCRFRLGLTGRTIVYEQDVWALVVSSQRTPLFWNSGSDSSFLHRRKDYSCHHCRIIRPIVFNANVYRSWSGSQELLNLSWRGIIGGLTAQKPTNIYASCVRVWLIVKPYTSSSPIFGGQSDGFGRREGDQKYVKGTCR